MLVPLTDSTNPYAAMMLELIRIQKARPTTGATAAHVAPIAPPRSGIRALFARFTTARDGAPARRAA
jgi:hypothetical protein